MLCPHCGSQIPDDSRACPRCRASLAVDSPLLASTDVAKDLPQQERRIRQMLIGIVLLAVLGWVVWNAMHRYREPVQTAIQNSSRTSVETIPVIAHPVTLKSHIPMAFGFVVPPGCKTAVLQSRFDETVEQAPAAQMTVFDEAAYAAWKSRQASRAAYTGRIKNGVLDVTLPPSQARYFLVLSSGSSAVSKDVNGQVQLICTRANP